MNAPTTAERLQQVFEPLQMNQAALPAIYTMPREKAIDTLVSSLYPGAKRESAEMVLAYCEAAGLDPMQKPVHIVPMSVKTGKVDADGNDMHEMRDVVMPGIGLYRIQATRTGAYAGQDEPEFGEMVPLSYRKKEITWSNGSNGRRQKKEEWVNAELMFPKWCKVTVYRIVQGQRFAFTAKELWLENYGTASRWSESPNSMWERRTFAQLAKCAEAQALRKAFPDAVGSGTTADEMEGKRYDFDADETGAVTPVQPPAEPPRKPKTEATTAPAPVDQQQCQAPAPAAEAAQSTAAPSGVFMATGGEKQNIKVRCGHAKRELAEVLASVLGDAGKAIDAETLEGLTKEQFKALRAALS